MDRHWLITWTCYGTWLPGNAAGFVGNVRDEDGQRVSHNMPGTPYDADVPRLEDYVRSKLKGPPMTLDVHDADALIEQYQETARVRQWALQAASVMHNHTHVVVSVPGDLEPSLILETLKSWATRALKRHRELPANGSFWTAKGSKRKLPDENALVGSVIYVVKKQPNPLRTYHSPEWQDAIDAYDRSLKDAN